MSRRKLKQKPLCKCVKQLFLTGHQGNNFKLQSHFAEMQSPDYVTGSLPSRNTDGTNLSSQDSSPAKLVFRIDSYSRPSTTSHQSVFSTNCFLNFRFMGAGVNNGVDNIPARFEEVSLSTIPNSSVEKEASGFSR